MMDILADIERIISALAALGAVVMGLVNSRKIQNVHVSINSRMDQLLQARGDASKAEGVEQGRSDARAQEVVMREGPSE
jgi:hypothetical protein